MQRFLSSCRVQPSLHSRPGVKRGATVAFRVAPRIVRIYTLRGFESVLAGSVQPGLLGDELSREYWSILETQARLRTGRYLSAPSHRRI